MHKINKVFKTDGFTYWTVFFSIMLLKFSFFGYNYYPVIDDWLQYGQVSLCDNIFYEKFILTKAYTVRPLAGIMDPFIWGMFFENMKIPFIVINLMHALSGYFLYKVAKYSNVTLGYVFLVVFGIMPLGFEATYWISASSRIVVGMYFMALSLFSLVKFIEINKNANEINNDEVNSNKTSIKKILRLIEIKNGREWLGIFFVFNIFSYSFYEQIAILSFTLVLILLVYNWNLIKAKWISIIPVVNLGIILFYYKFFEKHGQLSQRGKFIADGFYKQFREVLEVLREIVFDCNYYLFFNGIRRGWELLVYNGAWFYTGVLAIVTILAVVLVFHERGDRSIKLALKNMIVGLLLMILPLTIFLLISDPWIGLRNIFPSFVGFALFVEGAIMLVFVNYSHWAKALIIMFIVPIFAVVNVSELNDYGVVSQNDRKIVDGFREVAKRSDLVKGLKEGILCNVKDMYNEQNFYFHEHINNITESDWALTGAVWTMLKNRNIGRMYPIENEGIIDVGWLDKEKFSWFGLTENLDVIELNIRNVDDKVYLVTNENIVFGKIEEGRNRWLAFKHIDSLE